MKLENISDEKYNSGLICHILSSAAIKSLHLLRSNLHKCHSIVKAERLRREAEESQQRDQVRQILCLLMQWKLFFT